MTGDSWVEKYRPEDWDSLQGNNKAVKEVRQWIENWSPGDEPRLLHGDPGTGKSSTAFVAAEELDIPLNKVNLSEKRRSDELKQVAGSTKSSPPDHDFQLVLLDEIDNMHGQVNKKPLYEAIRNPRNPIIITANDDYEVPTPVKRASTVHEFKLGVRSRKAKLREIADHEDVDLSPSELVRLAERPDLRSAINDLQQTSKTDVSIGEDQRTWEEGEWSALTALLDGSDSVWRRAIGYEDDTFDGVDSALLWADENLSQEFRGLEAGVAYQILATADLWLGRDWGTLDSQDFRYRKYAWAMLALLPEARLSEPYEGYIDVSFPQWFRTGTAKHDGSTGEAQLYQALKGGERGFGMTGSFYEFREVRLPILRDLSDEEKLELAHNHRLDADAVEALGLDPADFDEWREVEAPEEGDGWSPDIQSAADASW